MNRGKDKIVNTLCYLVFIKQKLINKLSLFSFFLDRKELKQYNLLLRTKLSSFLMEPNIISAAGASKRGAVSDVVEWLFLHLVNAFVVGFINAHSTRDAFAKEEFFRATLFRPLFNQKNIDRIRLPGHIFFYQASKLKSRKWKQTYIKLARFLEWI